MSGGGGSVGRAVAYDTREICGLNPSIGKILSTYCTIKQKS